MAGADRAGPTADACAQEPGPARRGHGSERLAHLRDGPNPGGGDQRALHHGLEQGQRGRRQLRQDRPPLPAGAGPAGGSPWSDRGEGGEEAGFEQDRPRGPRGVRHDQCRPLQGNIPATVARPAQDGAAPQVPHAPGPGLPGGPHPARRRRPGQRRVPVRGAVQARRFLGIRPSSGGTGSGAGLRHHRVAGAGGAAHHGRAGVHGCPGR